MALTCADTVQTVDQMILGASHLDPDLGSLY